MSNATILTDRFHMTSMHDALTELSPKRQQRRAPRPLGQAIAPYTEQALSAEAAYSLYSADCNIDNSATFDYGQGVGMSQSYGTEYSSSTSRDIILGEIRRPDFANQPTDSGRMPMPGWQSTPTDLPMPSSSGQFVIDEQGPRSKTQRTCSPGRPTARPPSTSPTRTSPMRSSPMRSPSGSPPPSSSPIPATRKRRRDDDGGW